MPLIPSRPGLIAETERHLANLPTTLASETDISHCLQWARLTAGISFWNLAEFRAYLKRADELVVIGGPQDQSENLRRMARWVKWLAQSVDETKRFIEEWSETESARIAKTHEREVQR
jgi:hypothetical protein